MSTINEGGLRPGDDPGSAFDASLTSSSGGLAKDTNWWGAFVIGLSGTILVTGIAPFAVLVMGAASIPYFIGVTAMGVVLCFCLAELAASMPDRTGGLPSYAFETFQPLGRGIAKHLGGLSAWGYWLGWFTVTPINAILASGYIADLFGIPLGNEINLPGDFSLPITTTKLLIAAVLMLGLFIPCWLGIRLGAGFATVLGVAAIVPLTLVALLGFLKPSTLDWDNVSGFALPEGTTGSLGFYMAWIFIMTWSVLAMEAAACYIGECREPARDAKIAMTAEGIYGFFIYVMIPVMFVAVLGSVDGFDPLTVFTDFAEAVFGTGSWVRWFIGLTLIVALMLSVLNSLMGCARALYQNSEDGLLPRFFGKVNSYQVPSSALVFNLVCSFVLVFLGSPLEIYIFSNMGYLFAVALSLLGYFVYRTRRPEAPRPVKMPAFMAPLALVIGVFFLFAWGYGGFYASDFVVAGNKRWLFFLGLFLLALYVPLYYWRQSEDRRHLGGRTTSDIRSEEIDARDTGGAAAPADRQPVAGQTRMERTDRIE